MRGKDPVDGGVVRVVRVSGRSIGVTSPTSKRKKPTVRWIPRKALHPSCVFAGSVPPEVGRLIVKEWFAALLAWPIRRPPTDLDAALNPLDYPEEARAVAELVLPPPRDDPVTRMLRAQVKLATRLKTFTLCPTGMCFACGRQVFAHPSWDEARAARELASGCPYCNRSFAD